MLAPDFETLEIDPADLADPAAFLDAPAAVAVLEAGDTATVLKDLCGLRTLSAGNSLVLVVRDIDDEMLELALSELDPATAIEADAPTALLRHGVRRALATASPGRGARNHQRRAPALLGVSSAIRGVIEQVKNIAPSRMPVLILGETGTGKELVARAIHDQSERSAGPFVPVNCGALPETLLESELFGYAKGAFTGADREKLGLFEVASAGTLFLDEIGDTSPAMQAKLLRALEAQEIRPVGGTKLRQIDVRLVSATNRNLETAVEESTFRRDLYYRINTATIYVPPLRRRRVDIAFLAQHFAEEFGPSAADRITLDEDFLEALSRCEFRGNVRELRNTVERAIAMAAPDEPIRASHLQGIGLELPENHAAGSGTLRERLAAVELEALRSALARHDGNRTRAAAELGITRVSLRNKLKRLALEPGSD
jgi:transcriptional regulator with PAS, ATPase and Fis domain